MAVYKHSYTGYEGVLTAQWSRFLIIPRYAYRSVLKNRFFLIFLILSFMPPAVGAFLIYLRHNVSALQMLQIPVTELVAIDASFFLTLLTIQGWFAFLMTIYLGPGLVSPDLTNNALPLYLSRPFSKVDYVLGKMSVLAFLLSLITWLPLSCLYLLQSTLVGIGWWLDNLRILTATFLGAGLWILVLSLLALAVSAWVKWKPVAGAVLAGFFFVAAGFGEAVNQIFFTSWGDLINLRHLIDTVWNWLFFGNEIPRGFWGPPSAHVPVWTAILLLAAACLLCLALLARKIRAYEVVR